MGVQLGLLLAAVVSAQQTTVVINGSGYWVGGTSGTLDVSAGATLTSGGQALVDPLEWEAFLNATTVPLGALPCVHVAQCAYQPPHMSDGVARDVLGTGTLRGADPASHCYTDGQQHGCPDGYACYGNGACATNTLYAWISSARSPGDWFGQPAFFPMCENVQPGDPCDEPWPPVGFGDPCQADADAADLWTALNIPRNNATAGVYQPLPLACMGYMVDPAGISDLTSAGNPKIRDVHGNVVFDTSISPLTARAPDFPLKYYADGTDATADIIASGDYRFWSGCNYDGRIPSTDPCANGGALPSAMCADSSPGWWQPTMGYTGVTGDLAKLAGIADDTDGRHWEWEQNGEPACADCSENHWWLCMIVRIQDGPPGIYVEWDGSSGV